MITRSLKHGTFSYDEQKHVIRGVAEKWNKVYGFAFLRFVMSIVQYELLRKIKHDKPF